MKRDEILNELLELNEFTKEKDETKVKKKSDPKLKNLRKN
jgi:hypothetical protein